MKVELLEKARTRFTSVPELVNIVSIRAKQIIGGERPHVVKEPDDDLTDIVLREIIENKLQVTKDFASLDDED